jgi:hypothetical protein
MRVWLMVTMMALLAAVVVVACGGDEGKATLPAPAQAPVQAPARAPAPAEGPLDTLCRQAQTRVTDLQADTLRESQRLHTCQSRGLSPECGLVGRCPGLEPDCKFECRNVPPDCSVEASLLSSAERQLEQALRRVSTYCR